MDSSAQVPLPALSGSLRILGPLVLGTHNRNKIAALEAALSDVRVKTVSARELNLASPAETGTTVLENALLKARAFARESGHAAISDDSGFCISALDDLPGAAALDWAGPNGDYELALRRIGAAVAAKDIRQSAARYTTCIALALPDGTAIAEEGATHGELIWPPRGKTEGYLSVFAPCGNTRTVAETLDGEDLSSMHELPAYRHRQPTIVRLLKRVTFEAAN